MRTYIDNGETIAIDGMSIPKAGGHRLYIEFLELQGAGGAELVLPDDPTLDEAKASAIAQIKLASSSLADYLWPRVKAEAVRLAVPPFDATTQAQYSAFVQETLTIQYEAAAAVEACATLDELSALLDDLHAMYGDSLGV